MKVWRLSAAIMSGILLLAAAAIFTGIYYFNFPIGIGYTLLAVWLMYALVNIFLIPKIRHRIWRYEVHEHEIDLQFGVFIVKRVLIPMVRVQHVDTSQGPLLRKNNLATVTISTAATVHEIPALDIHEADELRDSISRLARVTDDV
nr:PH domain-containing protein [Metabacillus lacus]